MQNQIVHYDGKQAVKSGDKIYLCNKQSCEKNAQGKPISNRVGQAKATIDKPKSKQKNTPKLRCIFCCDRVVVLCRNFVAVFVADYIV